MLGSRRTEDGGRLVGRAESAARREPLAGDKGMRGKVESGSSYQVEN